MQLDAVMSYWRTENNAVFYPTDYIGNLKTTFKCKKILAMKYVLLAMGMIHWIFYVKLPVPGAAKFSAG
jgi:hypothetical protein